MSSEKHDPSVAIELLHHSEGLIALGENRANIVAAGNAALLVAYSSTDLLEMMFPDDSAFGLYWPAIFALSAVVLSVIALIPQRKSTVLSNGMDPQSYYFGCIGDMDPDDFISGYLERSDEDHVRMILRAVHMRSRKAKWKFTFLAGATIATVLQFAPMIGNFFA